METYNGDIQDQRDYYDSLCKTYENNSVNFDKLMLLCDKYEFTDLTDTLVDIFSKLENKYKEFSDIYRNLKERKN
jgi:hypothetical protein